MSDKETPSKGSLLNKHLQSTKQVKKRDKDLFKFHLVFILWPKFLKFWKLTHVKKLIFDPTTKLNCRELYCFG